MIKRILLLAIVIGGGMTTVAQNSIDTLFMSVSQRLSGHPSELIYLQTSKDIYETGEDLWFKAYQLDAKSFALSEQSETLYLQMLNDKDSVVWAEKYPIEKGIAEGHVYIDTKLSEGNYRLGTYTRHSYYHDTTGISPERKSGISLLILCRSIERSRVSSGSIFFPKEEIWFQVYRSVWRLKRRAAEDVRSIWKEHCIRMKFLFCLLKVATMGWESYLLLLPPAKNTG